MTIIIKVKVSVILLHLITIDATVQIDKQMKDAAMFMKSNGFHFVSLLSNQDRNLQKDMKYLINSNIYSKVQVAVKTARMSRDLDSLLILTSAKDILSHKIEKYLTFIRNVDRKKCLVVVTGQGKKADIIQAWLDGAKKFNDNFMFYLNTGTSWKIITYVKNTEKAVFQNLDLGQNLESIERKWDLQGLTVTSTSLNWMPYNGLSDCDNITNICKNSEGIAMIIANNVAKDINATITHIMEPDGTWNMNIPIELKMANSMNRSDLRNHDIHWNGVMGNVFKGKYQMSLSAWFRQWDRIEIFDFCQLYQQAGTVLAWSKKQMNEKSIDMGL